MPTGSINFEETYPSTGDILHLKIIWNDCYIHPLYNAFMTMKIYGPTGSVIQSYEERGLKSGSKEFAIYGTVEGTYSAKMTLFMFSAEETLTDAVYVSAAPPVEPPPTPGYYTVRIRTVPTGCTVKLAGHGTVISDNLGYANFYNVKEGSYEVIVEKINYNTRVTTISVFSNETFEIYLESPYQETCIPGETKCIGADMYKCNSSGTGWDLYISNAEACKSSIEQISFWEDPLGWITGAIWGTAETIYTFVNNQYNNLVSALDVFIQANNYQTQSFFSDPINFIINIIGDTYLAIKDFTSYFANNIGSWWDDTTDIVSGWIMDAVNSMKDYLVGVYDTVINGLSAAVNAVKDWVTIQIVNLGDTLTGLIGSVNDYMTGIIGSVATFVWNAIQSVTDLIWNSLNIVWAQIIEIGGSIADFVGNAVNVAVTLFWNELKKVSDLIGSTAGAIYDFISDTVLQIQTWVIEIIPQVVGAMFDWAKELVKPFLSVVDFLGQLMGIFTNTYPETEEMKNKKQDIKTKQDKIKEIIDGMD